MQANRERNIRNGSEYNRYFPEPTHEDPMLLSAGDTFDTIGFMKEIVEDTLTQTEGISKVLAGANLKATCNNIFDFLYKHVAYKPDDEGVEQLRSPARTWYDRYSGVDCDCYSIFISSVLSNLGITHAFRKTKYYGRSYFQHIYVVVPKNGKSLKNRNDYYTIDPVLDGFDNEHKFSAKHDLIMSMPIQALNGVPNNSSPPLMYLGEDETGTYSTDGEYVYRTVDDGLNGFTDIVGKLKSRFNTLKTRLGFSSSNRPTPAPKPPITIPKPSNVGVTSQSQPLPSFQAVATTSQEVKQDKTMMYVVGGALALGAIYLITNKS